MVFKMYNKTFQCYVIAKAKLYCNAAIYPLNYKFLVAQLNSPVLNYTSLPRGYSTDRSALVTQEYDKKYEEQLNEKLKDPDFVAKYNKFQLELKYFQSLALRVPETLKAYDCLQLLDMDTKGQKRSYLEYLWVKEMKSANDIEKQKAKQLKKAQERPSNEDTQYKLNGNTLFHRIRDQTIMQFHNSKLISAMLHSSPIVFDLSYEEYMTVSEKHLCAKQLLLAFSANRIHDDPCNLYFCNADKNSIIMQRLHKIIPILYDIDFPLNITSESHLKIFDKSKLVYLSPDCKKVITHYDHNSVYIIGALVDKGIRRPISYQKANRDGIKVARLPLNEKLRWGTGSSKTLPLNQVLNILLDLRYTNDWNIALQHVPKRKLKDAREKKFMRNMFKRQKLIEEFLKNV